MPASNWIGESIDKLISIEVRPQGFLNNIVHPLYKLAREDAGQALAWMASADLIDRVHHGSLVYVCTGHVVPGILPNGETDGPPGAAALARALRQGLGARVVILSETAVLSVLKETCRAAGLLVRDVKSGHELKDAAPLSIGIMPFPSDPSLAESAVLHLMDDDVTAIVAIEKIGRNESGIYNTGLGTDVTDHLCKIDLLVDSARDAGILTIGIGDLGNEIGFGRISEGARGTVPNPHIVTTVRTERLIVAGVSNWGAYGTVAALAVQLERPEVAHRPELEELAILASCRAGAVDGLSGGPTYEVDGLPCSAHMAIVELLNRIVVAGLSERKVERFSFECGNSQTTQESI